ncbi:MAG: HAD family phosphatase [Muribaculaceae bacterium]|nr:HAD family phosphatase [Muribaculaceae bacterium]
MIKNLLFDLGGVIMNIRRENCAEAFRQLGMADPDKFLGEYAQAGAFAGIENGSLSIEEFHDEIRRIIGRPDLTAGQIDTAFGKFLLGIPRHRLEELRELRKHYKVYMLSNTNPIMWRDGIAEAFRQEGHDVNYYFDGIVRSYEAHSMKPDEAIFRYTVDKLGITPEETLFIDDSQKNLDAAAALGFHTLLAAPGSEFYTLIKNYEHNSETNG